MAVCTFLLVWIILCGRCTIEVCLVGLLLGLLLRLAAGRLLSLTVRQELALLRRFGHLLLWVCSLLLSMWKANLAVSKRILFAGKQVQPKVVQIQPKLTSQSSRIALANGITLTPGTLTLSLDGPVLTIHLLDGSFEQDLEDNELIRRLAMLEGDKDGLGETGAECRAAGTPAGRSAASDPNCQRA